MDALATRLRADYGVQVDVLQTDLTDPAALARIETLLQNDERIGVLINRPLSPGRAFVTQVHQDVFGFDPDPATLDFIGGLLDQGQVTRLQVVQQVQAEIQYAGQLIGK